MYTLPEARDREADKVSALSSVYSRESPIDRVVRLEISTGCYWYALRIWMTRLLYSPDLIYYTEMNSLKWSLQLLTEQSSSVKNIKGWWPNSNRKSKGENLMIINGQIIARHTPSKD